MSLNPRYVLAPNLQCYFVDRDTGFPLSGGLIYTYSDANRTTPKEVFELQGNSANYTFAPLPNPIVLSAAGTIVDNNYNDIIPYWYPFNDKGELELYYIVVQNSNGVEQFVRQAWPYPIIGGGENTSSNGLINYIPNGQYLEHINLNGSTTPPYLLGQGTNIIAQGGFYIRLDSNSTSVNTWSYITEPYTLVPPQSPRYMGNLICSGPNALEEVKSHGIKFGDVNKFSAPPGAGGINQAGLYTYAFWGEATANVPFTIQVYKFFGTGGNPSAAVTIPLFTGELTTSGEFFNFDIDFGSNANYILGTNNDDFVAIEISFPTSAFLNVELTDHALVPFVDALDSFPVQTNADMMTRGVMGWADTIDPAGSQLYLPPILTPYGMTWDTSQIGDVGMSLSPVLSPTSTNPIPNNNKMPADGATYISADYSSNGIPYSRFSNYLRAANSTNQTVPLFGTGPNFVTALVNNSGAVDSNMRITYNASGTGSTLATDGTNATGFSFTNNFTFNGSTTGAANFGWTASSIQNPTQLLIYTNAQNQTASFTILDGGTSGMTFSGTNLTPFLGRSDLPNASATILTAVSGATLFVAGSGTGKYIRIQYNGNPTQVFWFQTSGTNGAPSAGGTNNEVKINSAMTASDVAAVLREAINAYNSTEIGCVANVPDGSYLLFYANPSSLATYYVWYAYSDSTVDPKPANATGIKVNVPFSTPTATQLRDLTRSAINAYQFQAPDFRGMFFRCADPSGTWDFGSSYRFSYTSGVGGPLPGTYEFQSFLSHNHTQSATILYGDAPSGFTGSGAGNAGIASHVTLSSGGAETRPVNAYIYPFIRY